MADWPLAEVIAAFSDSRYNLMNFNRGLIIILKKPDRSSVTSVSNMSYVAKGDKEYDAAGAVPAAKLHKIRITLTSSNVRNLEKCASLLYCLSNAVWPVLNT
jgi:hypothetical protein